MTQELTWKLVEATRLTDLPALFHGRSEKERKALVPEFKAEKKAFRTLGQAYQDSRRQRIRITGTAVLGSAGAIAQNLLGRWEWRPAREHDVFAAVLRDRGPELAGETVRKMAEKLSPGGWDPWWRLVDHLARSCGTAAPVTDGYVVSWVADKTVKSFGGNAKDTGVTLSGLMSEDPYFPEVLPRLFEVPGIGAYFAEQEGGDPSRLETWPAAFRSLADQGVIDRADLVSRCVSRLLRGEQPPSLRAFLQILERLELTLEETADHAVSLLRLLPESPGPVAAFAQSALRRLDDAGQLSCTQLEEACHAVFFRTEKKLVRAQFSWLDKAVHRHPELLVTAVAAFSLEAADLQERAVRLIARHLGKLDRTQREHVLDQAKDTLPLLSEALRPTAAELLGLTSAVGAPDPEPPAPPARELPPPINSLPELVEEIAVLVAHGIAFWSDRAAIDPVGLERVLAALHREHRRDKAALGEALNPLVAQADFSRHQDNSAAFARVALELTACAVRHPWQPGRFEDFAVAVDPRPQFKIPAPQRILLLRIYESARRLGKSDDGPYLAEPVTATGYIDPAALVRSLAQWQARKSEPWPRDLEQALLRLPRTIDPEVRADAAELTSAAGRLTARVLASGGLPDIPVEARTHTHADNGSPYRDHRDQLRYLLPTIDSQPAAYEHCAGLDELRTPLTVGVDDTPDILCWPLIAPAHRDVIAAHVASRIYNFAADQKGGGGVLPLLAEADGPIGPGLTLALCFGLAARQTDDRTAAVDAFLTLAARGEGWDPADTGRVLADLIGTQQIKLSRIAESVRALARAGAHGAVLGLLTGLLEKTLAGEQATKTAPLLETALECAAATGARGGFPELDAFAGRTGSGRALVLARRLRTALQG